MNQITKPFVIKADASKIPELLKSKPQWLNWNVGGLKEDGRYTKIPVNKLGVAINPHDPKNWMTFSESHQSSQSTYISGGIAFDLSGAQINEPTENQKIFLIGGDIDKCVVSYVPGNPPNLTENAQQIVDKLGTYYEVSPSGTGIRFFILCDKTPPNKNKGGYEIYHSGRFLTITGHGWNDIRTINEHELRDVFSLMFPNDSFDIEKPNSKQPILDLGVIDETDKVKSALSAVPPNINRQDWIALIYSVKAHNLQDGETLARNWSMRAGEYDPVSNRNGYSEKEFDKVWKYSPNSIGKGTLYYHARKYGWLGIQSDLFGSNQFGSDIEVYGDIFNGKMFKNIFEWQMLFCYPRNKWLRFDGTVWVWCEKGEALACAKQTAQHIAKMAADVFSKDPTNSNSKKIIQHAQVTHNINRLEAMLKVAAAEPNMGIGSMNQLDASPLLLGCKNGILDLSTGHLLFPSPDMLITRQVNATYNASAKAPTWINFLNQCFLNDQETVNYIQKALGYSLTGLVKEETLHFCFGGGRNGKSVFANIITKMMGDYALTAPSEMLMRRDRNSATNDIARLCGSRLVLANETRSDQRFDDLTIKQLVSTERISARFLHNEFFEFWPTFKIWIRGNHKPVVTDDSEGAWRRIKLVPFENNIPQDKVDPNLEEKLLQELDGILAWMVEGTLRWQSEGLTPSPRIKSASNQYRKECDIVGDFISELCSIDNSYKVSQKNLWDAWQAWSKENGFFTGSKKTFTRRLKDRGISDSSYVSGARAYAGIKLGVTPPSQDKGVISTIHPSNFPQEGFYEKNK